MRVIGVPGVPFTKGEKPPKYSTIRGGGGEAGSSDLRGDRAVAADRAGAAQGAKAGDGAAVQGDGSGAHGQCVAGIDVQHVGGAGGGAGADGQGSRRSV